MVAGGAIFAAIVIVAAHGPASWRLWGFDGLADVAPAGRWTWLALAGGLAATAAVAMYRAGARAERAAGVVAYALCAVPVVCALLLPSATALRGDGYFLLNQLTDPFLDDHGYVKHAPLAEIATVGAHRLGVSLGATPVFALRALDALAALVFGGAVAWHLRRFPQAAFRLVTASALILCGSLPLLAGLVEYYAPVHALVAVALVATHAACARGRAPWLGLAAVALASAYHAQAAVVLPAFVGAWPGPRRARLRLALYLAAGLAGLAAWVLAGGKGLLAPLGPPAADRYALLDGRHLLDLANLLAWGAPIAVFVLLPWLAARGRWRTTDPFAAFALGATVATWGLAVVASPELGMGRDADLLTLFALPATFWALRVGQGGEMTGVRHASGAIIGAALLVGLLGPLAQTAAQSREPLAVARHERLLALDPGRSAYGWENLGVHHRMRDDVVAGERAFRMALRRSGNPRYHVHLARLALQRGDLVEADTQAAAAVAAFPDGTMALGLLGQVRYLRDRIDEAVPYLMRAVETGNHDLDTYVYLAYEQVRTGDLPRARRTLDLGLRQLPLTDGRFHCLLGLVEERQGNPAAALAQYTTAIELSCPPPFDALAEQGRRRLGGGPQGR